MTPGQSRAARGLLDWTLRDLAEAAGINHNTVNSFETGRYAGSPETIAAMRKALEKAGIEFTNGKRPGVEAATEIATEKRIGFPPLPRQTT
ncbi:MAG: helix-turn-helix transcriptional regulator [Methyloceanibacter sp.]